MRPLACPKCDQLLHFEARDCPSCGSSVALDAGAGRFTAFEDGRWLAEDGTVTEAALCGNARYGACNWLAPGGQPNDLCPACRHNRTIPSLAIAGVLERWRTIEAAKRRALFGLVQLGLPPLRPGPGEQGLVFDILYDAAAEQGYAPQLMTGHQSGLITLNLIEADDAHRERARLALGEPYRTLVGHFRHELGHYYWHRFVDGTSDLGPFRAMFGDERADYAAALQSRYNAPQSIGWEEDFVSAYATVHPWEDFAETFAHYLHIVDTLAVIGSFDLSLARDVAIDFDPYRADTAVLVEKWIPLAFALNAINRSMGKPDLYPFPLTPAIVVKIGFVNRLIAFNAGRWAPGERENADLKAMIATLGHGVGLGAQ